MTMHPNFLLSFFLFVCFFLVDLPICLSLTDPSYTECSQDFNCGDIKGIAYPFWGNRRPFYCGHPAFELSCIENKTTEIQINSHLYSVLKIDQNNGILRIARTDDWDGNCPAQYINTSFDFTQFDFSVSTTKNLSLFYSCPSINYLSSNRFSCSVNQTDGDHYYLMGSAQASVYRDLESCKVSMVIPVLGEALTGFKLNQTTVETILKEGFDVSFHVDLSYCHSCVNSGGKCGHDVVSKEPICYCIHGRCPTGKGTFWVKMGIALAMLAFVSASLIILVDCLRRKASLTMITICNKRAKNVQKMEDFIKNQQESLGPKRYSYSDIKKITGSFKHKLGQGGCGSVFKGKLTDERLVAVKLLIESNGGGDEFINEVASITKTSHVNIVSLLGFCFDGSKRALVYEFMPNGSLEKFIYNSKSFEECLHLGWDTFFQIAVGIARGLEYLHRGCNTRILHFDIKPHNILLDQGFCPKISDFGLAKLCPLKESIISILGARGTFGYIAPELFCRNFGGVSHKSDVYSYGMMLLEMVGGRSNADAGVDHASEIYFTRWIYKRLELGEDLGLHGVKCEAEENLIRKMVLVGFWCIQPFPADRPSISRVVEMLEGDRDSLRIPPKPFTSTPQRSLSSLVNS